MKIGRCTWKLRHRKTVRDIEKARKQEREKENNRDREKERSRLRNNLFTLKILSLIVCLNCLILDLKVDMIIMRTESTYVIIILWDGEKLIILTEW